MALLKAFAQYICLFVIYKPCSFIFWNVWQMLVVLPAWHLCVYGWGLRSHHLSRNVLINTLKGVLWAPYKADRLPYLIPLAKEFIHCFVTHAASKFFVLWKTLHVVGWYKVKQLWQFPRYVVHIQFIAPAGRLAPTPEVAGRHTIPF
jgi:hypothetical protein